MDQLLQFAGRLHPLVLHAPIGFAIALLLLELLFVARRKPMPRDIRAPLAWLTAVAAAVAIASGLLLQEEGGHNADTVQLHQWLGISVGVCCLIAAIAQQLKRPSAYALALGAAIAVLIPAGHFGASMTHGENFLFEPFEPKDLSTVDRASGPDGAVPVTLVSSPTSRYATVIAPILQTRCYGCHGAERAKGGLRLNTPDAILRGGESGPAIVPADLDKSDLYRRISLPVGDDDHMPPKSKPQPTADEIAAIKAWIADGAKFDEPSTQPTVDQASGPDGAGPTSPQSTVPPPDPAALDAIRARLVHVEPIDRESDLLLIDFSAVAPTIDNASLATLLAPVREQTADLNLARTHISDDALSFLATFPNLRRLNLSSTSITERGLASLVGHQALAELVLTQTKLTDSAYETLTEFPALKHLYVWNSGLTTETIDELRQALSGVTIDAGDAPDAAALATETEIKLTDVKKNPAAAPANAAPAVAAADVLKPVNDTCPVLGTPIDPQYAIVYKGRVIGFCCRHCVAKFLEDPAKYEDKIH